MICGKSCGAKTSKTGLQGTISSPVVVTVGAKFDMMTDLSTTIGLCTAVDPEALTKTSLGNPFLPKMRTLAHNDSDLQQIWLCLPTLAKLHH